MDKREYEQLATLYLDSVYRVAVNECHSLWRTPWMKRTTYLEEMTTPEP